jgi:hypothetical protein
MRDAVVCCVHRQEKISMAVSRKREADARGLSHEGYLYPYSVM